MKSTCMENAWHGLNMSSNSYWHFYYYVFLVLKSWPKAFESFSVWRTDAYEWSCSFIFIAFAVCIIYGRVVKISWTCFARCRFLCRAQVWNKELTMLASLLGKLTFDIFWGVVDQAHTTGINVDCLFFLLVKQELACFWTFICCRLWLFI